MLGRQLFREIESVLVCGLLHNEYAEGEVVSFFGMKNTVYVPIPITGIFLFSFSMANISGWII